MTGGASMTRVERFAVAEPPVFFAVTVWLPAGVRVLGVPVTMPVAGLKARPAGSAGVMLHEVTGPPVLMGTMEAIAAALVKVNAEGM